MNFERINLNPSGRKAADCVVRALMKATGKTWLQVFDDLAAAARENFCAPNEKRSYEPVLEKYGFKKHPMPRFADNSRYTVAEFAATNPKGVFVISVANHLTCVVDGTLFDTWNCGYKSVCNFYK